MDWLKDKKNLPIVVGLAVFVLLAAGGLVAMEMGVFAGKPAEVAAAPPVEAMSPGSPGMMPPGSPGMAASPGMASAASQRGLSPAAKTALAVPAVPVAPKLTNPAVGPDPFNIPNGQKTYARQMTAQASTQTGTQSGVPLPLREILPAFDLFTLHSPEPLPSVAGPGNDTGAANYRLTAILNSEGGILAILETNGQSQQVKPGDGLPDGGKVLSIETSSVTLRTPGGSTVSIPLTSGAGPTDQPQNGQDPNAANIPGQPMDMPGQPFGQ